MKKERRYLFITAVLLISLLTLSGLRFPFDKP